MLRAPEPSDIDLIFKWENDPERLLHGRTGLPYSRHLIEEYIANYNDTALTAGSVRFMIEEGDEKVIGMADLYDIDFSARKAFVSIYIDSDYRRRNHAQTALGELLSFARDQLGLNMLVAVISQENTPSLRLFHKVGFSEAALLPNWMRSSSGSLVPAWLKVKML